MTERTLTWLDEIVPFTPTKRVSPRPVRVVTHPHLLSGLLVLVGLERDFRLSGKLASAAHAKKAARHFARRPVDWNRF